MVLLTLGDISHIIERRNQIPAISKFYGITVMTHPKDHNPPQVHAAMGQISASFAISSGELMAGSHFPPTGSKLVKEFILRHQNELLEMWETRKYKKLEPIE